MKKIITTPDLNRKAKLEAFDRLLTIMDELRENCPWDKKQTLESLRHLTIEETYELSDAIVEADMDEIKKELGDLMLHNVFYARIAQEKDSFDVADVLNAVCDKLINRHPHIYGDVEANDEQAVKENWEKIKLKEKGNKTKTVLGGVPKSLPALVKAMRIQEKARGAGFDWEKKEQVWEKVEEEMNEFKNEYNVSEDSEIDVNKAQQEFGDLLFSLINYARFIGVDANRALDLTNRKFKKRVEYIEKNATAPLADMTLDEMDALWNQAKKE